jgi:hypothetical protein
MPIQSHIASRRARSGHEHADFSHRKPSVSNGKAQLDAYSCRRGVACSHGMAWGVTRCFPTGKHDVTNDSPCLLASVCAYERHASVQAAF